MFEHFCALDRTDLILNPDAEVDGDRFLDACKKRASGVPLQYILGKWEFMGLPFYVTPDVLIPRADTETLAEYIIGNFTGGKRILDMCCGSGCIGLSLKHFLNNCEVTLCDISEKAIGITKKNADALGLQVNIRQCDLLRGGLTYFDENSFDIIVSNPPYITAKDMETLSTEVKNEPFIALYGGEDGADFYRALIIEWESVLKVGGTMALEVGYDTADTVYTLFCECGYSNIKKHRDLSGTVRVISAIKGI